MGLLAGTLWLTSFPVLWPDCDSTGAGGPWSLELTAAAAQKRGGNVAADFERFFQGLFEDASGAQQRALDDVTVSWQEEEQFGRRAVEQYLAQLRQQQVRVQTQGPDVAYLRSLVAMLQPQMQHARRYRTITVLLAESPEIDARSFAGGTIVVFRGLLDFVPNEAALVGILGHELSHIDHGHQLRYLKAMQLAQHTFAGGRPPGDLNELLGNTMLWAQILARPFRPEEEAEADLDGVTWAYRAGYDPRELARLFRMLEQHHGAQPTPIPSFLRSHPLNRERAEAVMRRYDELQRTEPRAALVVEKRAADRRRAVRPVRPRRGAAGREAAD